VKVCNCCKRKKPLEEFCNYRRDSQGHYYYCRECVSDKKGRYWREKKITRSAARQQAIAETIKFFQERGEE